MPSVKHIAVRPLYCAYPGCHGEPSHFCTDCHTHHCAAHAEHFPAWERPAPPVPEPELSVADILSAPVNREAIEKNLGLRPDYPDRLGEFEFGEVHFPPAGPSGVPGAAAVSAEQCSDEATDEEGSDSDGYA